jgi:hypothetical protein
MRIHLENDFVKGNEDDEADLVKPDILISVIAWRKGVSRGDTVPKIAVLTRILS